METGRMVILLNLENLYESLYDLLNQVYIYINTTAGVMGGSFQTLDTWQWWFNKLRMLYPAMCILIRFVITLVDASLYYIFYCQYAVVVSGHSWQFLDIILH